MAEATAAKRAITTGRGTMGPFSEAIAIGNLLFLSGKGGRNPETSAFGDIQDQTKWCLVNIARVLEAAGASMDNVVKVTVYLKEGVDWKAMNAEYVRHFSEPLPARTSLFCSGLANPEMLVEIEAIAVFG